MKAVKFGIIGTGAIARVHAEAIRLSGNCELVCVYDKIPERAAAFAAARLPRRRLAPGAARIGNRGGLNRHAERTSRGNRRSGGRGGKTYHQRKTA